LDSLNFSSQALSPAAVDSTNDRQPYTDSYSFTIARRLPFSSLLEVAYVGNRSRDLQNSGGPGNNINLVPIGAMLNRGSDPNTLVANDFRPLLGFSDLRISTNNLYANYNSLQATWVRSRGRHMVSMNYTYGKAMGILGNYDEFNTRNNYGVQQANRTHIFNAAYSIELGSFSKSKIGGAVLNGWQISGITQIQSGANLSGFNNQNFGMNLNSGKVPGTNYNISNVSILGTPNLQLNPILTCDPRANLRAQQYVNGDCFARPSVPGQNGGVVIPPIYGPAFFNSDLGIFKNFQLSESRRLQFKFDGYNFLNHPLWSFPGGNNLQLSFDALTGRLNNPNFGIATEKQGRRVVQMAVKFLF
jgi:hypothetical protein